MQIIVNYRELKEVDHFKYLGSVITRDGYCTREIKLELSWPNKHLTKIYHSPNKLNIDLRKKLVRCYVWSIAL